MLDFFKRLFLGSNKPTKIGVRRYLYEVIEEVYGRGEHNYTLLKVTDINFNKDGYEYIFHRQHVLKFNKTVFINKLSQKLAINKKYFLVKSNKDKSYSVFINKKVRTILKKRGVCL